jgi:hypothetical protein
MRSLLARFASFVAPFAVCGGVHAAEPGPLPPELVESFTKSIQPLVLNRCATGGCHAGQRGHAPLLRRQNAAGQIDRELTLANIDALRRGAETPAKARARTAILAVRHPGNTSPAPLSMPQMNILRSWLIAASEADAQPTADPAVRTAAHVAPAPAAPATNAPTTNAKPNRFRDLLENARNPAPLWPPPQEPKGVILKDEPADEEER